MTTALLTNELKVILLANGYFDLCVINNQIVGLHRYFTTTGVVIGLSDISYELRYCFQCHEDAVAAFAHYRENPKIETLTGNWIKVKGRKNGKVFDDFNPNWS